MRNKGNVRDLYKKILFIAIPVMVQNLITNFVALLDNIMVGLVGTEQMSGTAIVNQIFFVFNLTVFGAISGASIFCAQFFGKKDNTGIQNTFRFKILTVLILTVIGTAFFMLFGDKLITMYLHDAEKGIDLEQTFLYAKDYMKIMLWGLLPFTLEQAYSSTLREGGIATPPMVAGIAAVITNSILNYLLIFGIGPFPVLGVKGAAIATVISRFVQVGIVVVWSHLHSKDLGYIRGLYKTLRVPSDFALKVIVKGLIPMTANECLWAAGVATLVQCYSLRGIDVVASLNISQTVVNLFSVVYLSFGSGVSVVVGQLLGANDIEGAKKAAPKILIFAAVAASLICVLTACFAGLFPQIYNTTPEVKELATKFILISTIFMPVLSVLHSTYFMMRSGGKTVITFIFDCGFSWLIVVPLAYSLAHFTDLDIVWLYLCCQGVEILKCAIGLFLIKKGVWLSNIVSDEKF